MRKPVVGLDADGCILNFGKAYLKEFHSITGIPVKETQIDQWDISRCEFFREAHYKFAGRSNHKPLKRLIEDRCEAPGWARMIEPYKEALAWVPRLMRVADVYIVTSPWHTSPTWCHDRAVSLYTHFGIPPERVIFGSDKSRFFAHVFIDDKPKNITEWAANFGQICRPILFAAAYNAPIPGVVRTNDWETIMSYVTGAAPCVG